MKGVIATVLLLVLSQSLYAMDSKQIKEVNGYLDRHEYLTAIRFLDRIDPKNLDPEAVVLKSRIALEDSVQSINDKIFAFKDLAPGETIASLRRKGGHFSVIPFDIPEAVGALLKTHPDDGPLYSALADFYVDVTQRCGCSDLYPNADRSARENYLKATSLGFVTEHNQAQLGLLALKGGDYKLAESSYRRALEFDPGNPSYDYNLAFALIRMGQFAAASPLAHKAYLAYKAPSLKRDAFLMFGDTLLFQGETAEALTVYSRLSKAEPKNLFVIRRLLQCYLTLNKHPELSYWFQSYLSIGGNDPNEVSMLSHLFMQPPRPDLFVRLSEHYLAGAGTPKTAQELEADGILCYYEAFAYEALGKRAMYVSRLKEAKADLAKVYPPDNPVFKQIEDDLRNGQ